MKLFSKIPKERKAFYLLLCCIACLGTGFAVLTVGALAHVNPDENLVGLFQWNKVMNLVYSIIPAVK